MKKAIFHGLLWLFWLCLVSGCTREDTSTTGSENAYSLHGYVRHSITNEKVPDVIVEVAGQVCTTKSAGYYYFDELPKGSYHLTASRDGSVLYETDVQIDGLRQHDFNVYYSVSLYGWVSHTIDGAIAGAIIQIGDLADTTSVTGYYEFVLFVPGQFSLTCHKDEYNPVVMDISITEDFTRTDIDLMRSHARVYGIVSHSVDGPVFGAVVQLDTLADTTSTQGYYEFNSVALGMHQLCCSVAGFNPIDSQVAITIDVKRINLILDKVYCFSGSVYHIEDGPIEGAYVIFGLYTAITDENGCFIIENLLEGSYDLIVSHEEYLTHEETVSIENDKQIDIRIRKNHVLEWAIEEDTYVGIMQYSWDYQPTTYWPVEGQSERLLLDCGIIWVAPQTEYMWQTRIFIKIPSINCMGWDEDYSFKLLLISAGSDDPFINDFVIIHSVSEPWSEDEITWVNQPGINSPELGSIDIPNTEVGDSVLIDITSYACGNLTEAHGLRFSYRWDFKNNEFYSSEATDVSKRPKVIGTFTY